jgi:hypothetical protein
MRCKRSLFAAAASAVAGLAIAGGAGAAITEVGPPATSPTSTTPAPPLTPPSCPNSPCLAVSRTTGFQVKVGTQRGVVAAPRAGRLVAWTITLGTPSPTQIKFFDAMEGGNAQAGIAILRPGKALNYTLIASSPVMHLQPYFGKTVQFPLITTLPVNAGDIVALSVPTWAPALALGYGHDTSWRASRGKTACANTGLLTTQTTIGATTQYYCLYGTARLTYSGTLISTP